VAILRERMIAPTLCGSVTWSSTTKGRAGSASSTSERNKSGSMSQSSTKPWCGASRATSRARSAGEAHSTGKSGGNSPLSESTPSRVAHSLRCRRSGFISAASTA
jgi:hypothetical protein